MVIHHNTGWKIGWHPIVVRRNSVLGQVFRLTCGALVVGLLLCSVAPAQDSNLVKALKIQPKQRGVEFDTPSQSELADCKIENAKIRFKQTGWAVIDQDGRVIRRFIDTNRDTHLDQWSYYKDGIEVYRDIDSNFDKKADQYRWLGTEGVRWGIDKNQDGEIDSWQMISAEEVSFEVVEAIKNGDAKRFARLTISEDEIKSLGLGKAQQIEITNRAKSARDQFSTFAKKQKMISPKSSWVHFGGMRPGVVPAGTDGLSQDVIFYDSVAAVIDNGGRQHGQIAIGTLIQVGNTWRVVDLPEPIEEGKAVRNGAIFFQASARNLAETKNSFESESGSDLSSNQALFADYEEIDRKMEKATGRKLAELHADRAKLITKMIDAATDKEDRSNWSRQLADMVSGAYQNGDYDGGIKFLQGYVKKMKSDKADVDDLAYTEYRLITSYFSRQIDEATSADLEKVQSAFMDKLRDYVKVHPKSAHTADAMMQLGLAAEFAGEINEAKDWYSRIAKVFPSSPVAKKAGGANTRLNSQGRRISFGGRTLDGKNFDLSKLRGKTVLIQYWATWCEPCKADMTTIKKMHDKYQRQGFVVVGVSLDNSSDEVKKYLDRNRLPWIHLYEEGGLDSRLAEQLGVALVPTMILVGADGKVVDRNIAASDLDRQLSRQFGRSGKKR